MDHFARIHFLAKIFALLLSTVALVRCGDMSGETAALIKSSQDNRLPRIKMVIFRPLQRA
jgi:hypothetical protein